MRTVGNDGINKPLSSIPDSKPKPAKRSGKNSKPVPAQRSGKNSKHVIESSEADNKMTIPDSLENSPGTTDVKKRRVAPRRALLNETDDVNVLISPSKAELKAEAEKRKAEAENLKLTANTLFYDVKHKNSLNAAIQLLDAAKPDVIEALSKKKFPPIAQAAMNRRVLSERLKQAISKNGSGLFRINGNMKEVKDAVENFSKKPLPEKMLNNPAACAHLFKEILKQKPPLLFAKFSDSLKLKEEFQQAISQLTEDSEDSLKIGLSVIRQAYNQAPEKGSGNHDKNPEISKDALLGIFTENVFSFPKEGDQAQQLKQNTDGKLLLKSIVEQKLELE